LRRGVPTMRRGEAALSGRQATSGRLCGRKYPANWIATNFTQHNA